MEKHRIRLAFKLALFVIGVSIATTHVTDALAAGYGQGNFDRGGPAWNQIGADAPTGFPEAPAVSPQNVTYIVPVHRYAGSHHIPVSQEVNLTLIFRVARVNKSGGETVIYSKTFVLHLAPNQESTTLVFGATLPPCGTYEIDTGMPDASHAHDFAVLTTGFATTDGCDQPTPSPTPTSIPTPSPTPTGSTSSITTPAPTDGPPSTSITVPDTGVGGHFAAVPLAALGAILVVTAVSDRRRRFRLAYEEPKGVLCPKCGKLVGYNHSC